MIHLLSFIDQVDPFLTHLKQEGYQRSVKVVAKPEGGLRVGRRFKERKKIPRKRVLEKEPDKEDSPSLGRDSEHKLTGSPAVAIKDFKQGLSRRCPTQGEEVV
jgi:hypothetical protein